MKFNTVNPATEEVIAEYETMSYDEVFSILESCEKSFLDWKRLSISERVGYISKLAAVLRNNQEKYAKLITLEMGKPITESMAEIEKCAWTAEVYAANAEKWLEEEHVRADGKEHIVAFQPLGVILSVMPWNFPFW